MGTTTAYFAGIGTVIAAIAAGLGGGLVLGNIMSPQQPKHPSSEVSRLEQRATQPIPAVASASQVAGASQPVPYLETTQAVAATAEPATQAQPQQAPTPPAQSQPVQAQAAQSPAPAEKQAQSQPPQKPDTAAQSAAATPQPSAAELPARAAPENSYARARDSDVRREARRERKAERQQRWAERRRGKQRDDDGLRDAEAKVRELTDSRPTESRPLFSREPSFGTRINLFDD